MSIEMHQMILFMIFKMNGILAFLFDAEKNKNLLREVVELDGIEPTTFSLPARRSPS
jgi:hypothetical protein